MRILLTIIAVLACFTTEAQATKTAAPKYSSSWGRVQTGDVAVDRLIQIVDSAISVKDEKGAVLTVTGFRINYTFISTFKDQESGQLKTVKDFRAYDVTDGNILTQMWKDSIRDNAKPGDEIIINHVKARMKNGKSTFAPDLRLKVTDK